MKEKILIVEDEFVEANFLRNMLERAGYPVCGVARSFEKAVDLVAREKPGLVLLDIFLTGKETGIDLARRLKEQAIAFVYLSANSNEEVLDLAKATEPYGFLVKPFREHDLLITLEIAQYRHTHSLENKYRQERALQQQLEKITGNASSWEEKLLMVGKVLQPHVGFDFLAAFYHAGESDRGRIGFLRVGFDEYQTIGTSELKTITKKTTEELEQLCAGSPRHNSGKVYTEGAFEQLMDAPSMTKLFIDTFELEACLTLPLFLSSGENFTLSFFSRRPDSYTAEHLALLERLQSSLTKSLETILPGKAAAPPTLPAKEPIPASAREPDSNTMPGFEGIIGKSHLLLNVFDNITQVADTDTSVLILGESGTGKEAIASCIHRLSQRKDQRMVKVNCAAIAPTLIESELFGHEKGAFTGAVEKRIGKFEQADKGTIFLDEIGELPLESQAKLLHVLQDREIERLGSKGPVKIDVRVIAATNRNLEKEVAEGRFRLDLYYRLNVIPLQLPPLRERKEDLPDLARHFIDIYNRKAGRRITGLSEKAMRSLLNYSWPGNVRELEHIIERCVLLAKATVIEDVMLPNTSAKDDGRNGADVQTKTIQENERDHILSVLRQCKGKIWGPGAAAEILNLPPTTLRSKMKKLGIEKKF